MNRFFTAALAVTMTLASCSQEDGLEKGKSRNGEETYAGVSITLPSTGVRADDPDAGIAGEKAVTSIGVYIVDVNSNRLDYKLLNVATDFTSATVNNQQVYKATASVPTVTGTKKVYVVANPTTAIQNKLGTSGATAMNAIGFGLTQDNFLTGTLTSMVMSGAYTATGGVLDMTSAKTAAEAVADANLVNITIGRNLAKAVVQEATNYSVTGGTTTLTWTLMSKATDAYFLSQSAGTLYRTVPSAALDPITGLSHSYWSNFEEDATYIPVLPKGADSKTATYAQSKYMFENIPQAMYVGNTTAARIKGVFKPHVIYNNVTADGTLTDIGNVFGAGTTFHRSTIDGSYWTAAGRTAAISIGYLGHTATDFLTYTDGVGYYVIYVNDGSVKEVARNSYYLMQINEVRGPGSPTEPSNPIDPVEDDTNLGVNVTVLNWDFKKSEQNIQ